jgi:hypothetical protein
MDYRVSYEHSLASAPEDFIAKVPSQLVEGVPANISRALLPEFISDLIRTPAIGFGQCCRTSCPLSSSDEGLCYAG